MGHEFEYKFPREKKVEPKPTRIGKAPWDFKAAKTDDDPPPHEHRFLQFNARMVGPKSVCAYVECGKATTFSNSDYQKGKWGYHCVDPVEDSEPLKSKECPLALCFDCAAANFWCGSVVIPAVGDKLASYEFKISDGRIFNKHILTYLPSTGPGAPPPLTSTHPPQAMSQPTPPQHPNAQQMQASSMRFGVADSERFAPRHPQGSLSTAVDSPTTPLPSLVLKSGQPPPHPNATSHANAQASHRPPPHQFPNAQQPQAPPTLSGQPAYDPILQMRYPAKPQPSSNMPGHPTSSFASQVAHIQPPPPPIPSGQRSTQAVHRSSQHPNAQHVQGGPPASNALPQTSKS
ncbi:hypothetical protein BJ508DRAFT_334702 [Ascobolus immersus RN42]|uniref:Uncharacterized protein n=1 Tax=Ascobolus immersus RN42 TaxID=1160509 RepID=A0A3N4HH01_ASCIM|nr:hypothetical protein BJ508DRAFT_334702 [Ascobolus immersus RN42]